MTTLTPISRPPRYVSPSQTSLLMSERAEAIAEWVTRRANRRAAMGLERGSFDGRYMRIVGMARRRYPLPLTTTPVFRTDSPKHEVPKR